jgi:tetratricopeptide (TPR) repeat protein
MKPATPLTRAAILAATLIFAMLIGLWLPSEKTGRETNPKTPREIAANADVGPPRGNDPMARLRPRKKLSAEQIVAKRFALFAKKRQLLVERIAKFHKTSVPPEIEKFFELLKGDDWEATKVQFHALATRAGQYDYSTTNSPDLAPFWRPVVEAYGAAEQVRMWPAQQLLDYGNSIIDSLQPGMVYVGGTDPGCFIPTMLNETGDGDQHVMLTQNALADQNYLNYIQFLYGGQIDTLTGDQLQQAYDQYTSDAQARMQHDQNFPDESPQLMPGENVSQNNGKFSVTGVNSVMAINGILLQDLVQQNPDLSFAMEESFPIPSTYAGGTPLGPIMELGANTGDSTITPDTAEQTVNYWETTAQTLVNSSDDPPSDPELKTYAHDAQAQANLLANNNFPDAADQLYQTALDLWPDDLGTVRDYAGFLNKQGQTDEANDLLDNFSQNNPAQSAAVSALRNSMRH